MVQSEQLGAFEVPEQQVVTFPFGLPGFPLARRFCMVEVRAGSQFKLLQDIEREDLAFVVTDPLLVDQQYPLQAAQQQAAMVGMNPDQPLAVAAIVTVPPPPASPTVNLAAPLVMGMTSQQGVQVIIPDSSYLVRHPLNED